MDFQAGQVLVSSGILEAMRVLKLNTRAWISLTKLFLDLVMASTWSGTSSAFWSYSSEMVTLTMVQTWSKVLCRLVRIVHVSGFVPLLSKAPILSRWFLIRFNICVQPHEDLGSIETMLDRRIIYQLQVPEDLLHEVETVTVSCTFKRKLVLLSKGSLIVKGQGCFKKDSSDIT